MTFRFKSCLILILILVATIHAQTASQPFASFERAVAAEPSGWAGDKSKLSAVFDSERRQLGDRFEAELLKWLGQDPERHYWISTFLEAESYLHGNKRLPQLSLLLMEQGLSLVRNRSDEASQGFVVRFSTTAATLSAELGLASLAKFHKAEVESLLKTNPNLSTYVPGMTDADRRFYESIPSTPPIAGVVTDNNPAPKAQVSGGVLNAKAIELVKPAYPLEARKAGASGTVEVKVVFDEEGKVIWARAMSGHPLLRATCEDAAWRSTFTPVKLSGQPVKVMGVLLYNFVK